MKANKFVLGAVFTFGVLLLLDGCATTKSTGHMDLPEGRYEGEVKDGKPNGQGVLYYADADEKRYPPPNFF